MLLSGALFSYVLFVVSYFRESWWVPNSIEIAFGLCFFVLIFKVIAPFCVTIQINATSNYEIKKYFNSVPEYRKYFYIEK